MSKQTFKRTFSISTLALLAALLGLQLLPAKASALSTGRLADLTNSQRAARNLPGLEINGLLSESANKKAEDMCLQDYWAHASPSGVEPWQVIAGTGYQYLNAGENLAKGFPDEKVVVSAWMNSPAHRANVLRPEFTQMGFAVRSCQLQGQDVSLVVAHYGQPLPMQMESEPEPAQDSTFQALLSLYQAISSLQTLSQLTTRT